jgi:6,7-dimethyl-8-ribityllumazine synthase
VALGLVIRGETSHYDYVCNAVERGCSQLQLEHNKPVAFGVLTTENRSQAEARCGGAKGNKGAESAQVVLDMLQVLDSIHKL